MLGAVVAAMAPVEANLVVAAGAEALEAAVGYPLPLFRAVRHPVVWVGELIALLDRGLNRAAWRAGRRRAAGVVAIVVVLAIAAGPAAVLQRVLSGSGAGLAAVVVLASALPAQRSLHQHVAAVARALEAEGVAGGRRAVALIVGRDPASLDAAGVARAAIESLAENFSDGVVAPLFWGAVAGLGGMAGYKAVNTADSMVGHRTPRHAAFGWASARLDDVVNWPAARLAAAVIALASGRRGGWIAAWRDAGRHRSPNAGWPEAAMAGSLGLRLAGPRRYGGVVVGDAWMGDGRAEADAADIWRALRLYRRACGVQLLGLIGLALWFW